jgi:hypothetical protein
MSIKALLGRFNINAFAIDILDLLILFNPLPMSFLWHFPLADILLCWIWIVLP